MSSSALVSLFTRSEAELTNATNRPLALMTGSRDMPLPVPFPAALTLIRMFDPVMTSRTNTSARPLASFDTRFATSLTNATNRPSPLTLFGTIELAPKPPHDDNVDRLLRQFDRSEQ